jgi:hypothetical protein
LSASTATFDAKSVKRTDAAWLIEEMTENTAKAASFVFMATFIYLFSFFGFWVK